MESRWRQIELKKISGLKQSFLIKTGITRIIQSMRLIKFLYCDNLKGNLEEFINSNSATMIVVQSSREHSVLLHRFGLRSLECRLKTVELHTGIVVFD